MILSVLLRRARKIGWLMKKFVRFRAYLHTNINIYYYDLFNINHDENPVTFYSLYAPMS